MKLQFKHQDFQADAARAVVDVFAGQPFTTPSYSMDRGENYQHTATEEADYTGWNNHRVVEELSDRVILQHLNQIQKENQIPLSEKLEKTGDGYNLTVEMETGVGKTYTYIKTMYELNRAYGWSKFIVVVPSIAIREGVYQSFQVTQEHFAEEYGKKIRFFIYNSNKLAEIDSFASNPSISVMIINAQSFNARSKDARRIYMKLDDFRSRRPIDVIAATKPIVIIDEPQSVEGKQTKENLKQFHPLMTLRYSATHRADSIYNMVYRLDAMDAYNRHLVKKIAVKGITETGNMASDSFLYLEGIQLSKADPVAVIQFDYKGPSGIGRKTRRAGIGFNLYAHSGELQEYKDGFVVKSIDGREDSIELTNGIKLYAGDVMGEISEEKLRRIQIRETILSHIERERQLFNRGIKVLSLFFIDEVAHYKTYDEAGQARNGIFARMFEEEYQDILDHMQRELGDQGYMEYLKAIPVAKTHAGYFSIDKKGHIVNQVAGDDRKSRTSNDMDAYDLIMRNKELLLDLDPYKSPVRFLFSHSALREGWDNPNVFQICTLKQSGSDIRKRQEVGRGLRLCVNQEGERMDVGVLGAEVHDINVLTVIASESYDSFVKELQTELAEALADRPKKVTAELFTGRVVKDSEGNEWVIHSDTALAILYDLIINGYVNKTGALTDKYYQDKADGRVELAREVRPYTADVLLILDSVYNSQAMCPKNARSENVRLRVDEEKLDSQAFKELWSRIHVKSVYTVDFDTEELIRKSIASLNGGLRVSRHYVKVESGQMKTLKSREELLSGDFMVKDRSVSYQPREGQEERRGVTYDLVGKLVDETGLTRKAVIQILTGMEQPVFHQFKDNPEEFIIKASNLIKEQKAAVIMEHIRYKALKETYGTDLLTKPVIRGKLGVNVMKADKHLYDYVVYDSANEKIFAEKLDKAQEVAVYVKLPKGFYISTPVGRYSPDWAIAFHDGAGKYTYVVAETKATMDVMQLRMVEEFKLHCAREHFKAVGGGEVKYEMADRFEELMKNVKPCILG